MSRNLKGFMIGYCQELTGLQTTSLKKFLAAVLDDTPRAFEPLVLLAIAQGREDYLERLAADTPLALRCSDLVAKYRDSGLSPEQFARSLPTDDRLGKAAAAWRSEVGRLARDRKTLEGVARAMLQLMEEKGITRAQACRQLGLDKGNFYAFLKGDVTRLGRTTAISAYHRLVG